MRFVREFDSPCSAEETLRLIADFQYLTAWDESALSVTPLQSAFGLGAAYSVVVAFNGREIPMRYEVTSYVSGHSAVLRGVAESALAIDRISVMPQGEGCRVTYDVEIRMAFPYSLFDWLAAFGFRKTIDRAVEGLLRFLRAQHRLRDDAAKPAVGE